MIYDNFSSDLLHGSSNLQIDDHSVNGSLQGHHTQIGNNVFHTGADGSSHGFSQKVGNTVYHHDAHNMITGSSQMLGADLHHYQGGMHVGRDHTLPNGDIQHFGSNGMLIGRTDAFGHEFDASGKMVGFSFKKF